MTISLKTVTLGLLLNADLSMQSLTRKCDYCYYYYYYYFFISNTLHGRCNLKKTLFRYDQKEKTVGNKCTIQLNATK